MTPSLPVEPRVASATRSTQQRRPLLCACILALLASLSLGPSLTAQVTADTSPPSATRL